MRKIALLLLACLGMNLLYSDVSRAVSFLDVRTGYAQKDAITYLARQGVLAGYADGYFRPNNTVNRAELTKIVVAGQGIVPNSSYKNCFPDIASEWYAPYVCYAKEQGWVHGYGDGYFRPSSTVNRAEASKIVLNSLRIGLLTDGGLPSDVVEGAWYVNFARTVYGENLLDVSNFLPSQGMSRGEVSEMLYRILVMAERKAGQYGESLLSAFDSYLPPSVILPLYYGDGRTIDDLALQESNRLMDEGIRSGVDGDWQEALNNFERGIYFDTTNDLLWARRAQALYYLERYKEARFVIDQAIAINPARPTSFALRSAILFDLGLSSSARETLARAVEMWESFGYSSAPIDPVELWGDGREADVKLQSQANDAIQDWKWEREASGSEWQSYIYDEKAERAVLYPPEEESEAEYDSDYTSPEAAELFELINGYRAEKGLAYVPPSPALDQVALAHVRDLNASFQAATHAWSDADYNPNDSSTYDTMWQAARRLKINYNGNIYECIYWKSSGAKPENVLASWKASTAHNTVITNQGKWANKNWKALGVAVEGDYASIWLGESLDPYFASQKPSGQSVSSVTKSVDFSSVDLADENAVAALGGPSVKSGSLSFYTGYVKSATQGKNPVLIAFQNSKQLWVKKSYETNTGNATGYGLLWDKGNFLYAVFSIDNGDGGGDRDFRQYAADGWITKYGVGGGVDVAVVARIDPKTGQVVSATYVSGLMDSGHTSGLVVTDLQFNYENVALRAESQWSPRRIDATPMEYDGRGGTAPFTYKLELKNNLTQAVWAESAEFGE